MAEPLFHLPAQAGGAPLPNLFIPRADAHFTFELCLTRDESILFFPHKTTQPASRGELHICFQAVPEPGPAPAEPGFTLSLLEPNFLASRAHADELSLRLVEILSGPTCNVCAASLGGTGVDLPEIQRLELAQVRNQPTAGLDSSLLWLERAGTEGASEWALGIRFGENSGGDSIYVLQNEPKPALVVHRFTGQNDATLSWECISLLHELLSVWSKAPGLARRVRTESSAIWENEANSAVAGITSGYRRAVEYLRENPVDDHPATWYEIAAFEAELRLPWLSGTNDAGEPAAALTARCHKNGSGVEWELEAPPFLIVGPDRALFLGRLREALEDKLIDLNDAIVFAPRWDAPGESRYLVLARSGEGTPLSFTCSSQPGAPWDILPEAVAAKGEAPDTAHTWRLLRPFLLSLTAGRKLASFVENTIC